MRTEGRLASVLLGRKREPERLDGLLRDGRGGERPGDRVSRAIGVESESEIAFATLQRLCAPLMAHVDRLPEPQRAALEVGFGVRAGTAPDALLVGLAVLGLFAEAAADQSLLCVVDDVQWLDRMSEVILTFVARRLDAESVAL